MQQEESQSSESPQDEEDVSHNILVLIMARRSWNMIMRVGQSVPSDINHHNHHQDDRNYDKILILNHDQLDHPVHDEIARLGFFYASIKQHHSSSTSWRTFKRHYRFGHFVQSSRVRSLNHLMTGLFLGQNPTKEKQVMKFQQRQDEHLIDSLNKILPFFTNIKNRKTCEGFTQMISCRKKVYDFTRRCRGKGRWSTSCLLNGNPFHHLIPSIN